jgi:hypothetical protein
VRIFTLVFWPVLALPALAAANADLEQARTAYRFGDYKRTIQLLLPVLYPTPSLPTVEDQVAARRLLGLAFLFERNEAAAEREFVALLRLAPNFQLDPLLDPPSFVDFFNRVRTKYEALLRAEEQRRREEAEIRRLAEVQRAEEAAERERQRLDAERYVWVTDAPHRSRWLALVPLGVGQFQNGERAKGHVFLWSELVLGAASMSLALAVRLRYPEGTFESTQEERDTADALVSAQVITGALFLAVAAYGVADALYHYDPTPKPRRVPRDSLRLGPAGLELRF